MQPIPALRPLLALAGVAGLDVQSADSPVATLHQILSAANGASAVNGPVRFTLLGDGIASRNREFHDPMLRDFAMIDGDVIGAWGESPRQSRLVFIGRDIHREELEAQLLECLA